MYVYSQLLRNFIKNQYYNIVYAHCLIALRPSLIWK